MFIFGVILTSCATDQGQLNKLLKKNLNETTPHAVNTDIKTSDLGRQKPNASTATRKKEKNGRKKHLADNAQFLSLSLSHSLSFFLSLSLLLTF